MGAADAKTAEATAAKESPLAASHSVQLPQVDVSDKEVQRIYRKIDVRLLPVLSVLYLMSYLDRGNSKLNA